VKIFQKVLGGKLFETPCTLRECLIGQSLHSPADKGSSDSTDHCTAKRIVNMFKSTDMVETRFGHEFGMFRLQRQSDAGMGSNRTPSICYVI